MPLNAGRLFLFIACSEIVMFDDTETVSWEIAEEVGGPYFSHARRLGLPLPPKAFVYADKGIDLSIKDYAAIGHYHVLFEKAERAHRYQHKSAMASTEKTQD